MKIEISFLASYPHGWRSGKPFALMYNLLNKQLRMLSPPKVDLHQSFWGWMLQISLIMTVFSFQNSIKSLLITLFPTNFISSLSLALFYVITRFGHITLFGYLKTLLSLWHSPSQVLMNNQKKLSQKRNACMFEVLQSQNWRNENSVFWKTLMRAVVKKLLFLKLWIYIQFKKRVCFRKPSTTRYQMGNFNWFK